MKLDDVLRKMVELGSSDLFVKVGMPPACKVNSLLNYMEEFGPVSDIDARDFLEEMTDDYTREVFRNEHEVDTAHELHGVGRFRVNAFLQRGHIGFVLRHISSTIPTFQDLRLPEKQLLQLAQEPRGLILVTGITGSGKSTTLASFINHINNTFKKHIITIEDPIEYVYDDALSLVDQREIGMDTRNFGSALKACMRQAPDVILIGEMRDTETMNAAISAAETGHLVLGTLHSVDASQTCERIMNFYPPHQHELIRMQMSMLLKGVISQRLLRTTDGKGRLPALEILLPTPRITQLILEGETPDIYDALKEGNEYYGTITFNHSVTELYNEGLISYEDAMATADKPDEFELASKGISKSANAGDFDFGNF